jgi:asparagine synthase (glutamine-hydrolysing)
VGFFLSGGLDSSIVAALGKQILGPAKTRTCSVGLNGSPDLIAARKMADFLGSDHTEVIFTVDEGLEALKEVIWHLETYDTTTIRASIPMYLLSKYIKENTDIRVVLSGEGSDELFGGYLYFHGAPSEKDFLSETVRLIKDVHMFDVLRADRTTSAHGLELRVPFFDKDFIECVMSNIPIDLKVPRWGFEKYILREVFSSILHKDIAWRQKNGMSDAVGYEWAQALRDFGEDKYKAIFNSFFGENDHLVPYKWMPKWTDATDPSGATLTFFRKDSA